MTAEEFWSTLAIAAAVWWDIAPTMIAMVGVFLLVLAIIVGV